jgi:hypothetical protein
MKNIEFEQDDNLEKLFWQMDVSSGLDEITMKKNLCALNNLLKRITLDPPNIEIFKKKTIDYMEYTSCFFAANILIAWFWALGIDVDTLELMLGLGNITAQLKELGDNLDLHSYMGSLPLPHFINVKMKRSLYSIHLFGNTHEDASITCQVRVKLLCLITSHIN